MLLFNLFLNIFYVFFEMTETEKQSLNKQINTLFIIFIICKI